MMLGRAWVAVAVAAAAAPSPHGGCLAGSGGAWVASTLAPVVLDPAFLKNWAASVFFWGRCAREPDALRFERTGAGCGALAPLAASPTLAAEFCDAFRGATLLIVGDSVQGELFSTVASLLGATAGVQDRAEARRRCLRRARLATHQAHEVVVDARACAGTVGLRFVRNEFVLWAGARALKNETELSRHNTYVCDWAADAAAADLLLLSRGLHAADDATFAAELDATFAGLADLRGAPRGPWVMYRGSHAVVPRCRDFADPSPVSLADAIVATPGVPFSGQWANISRQNGVARRVAEAHGAAYFDVFDQTALRPGAKLDWREDECMHFCVPGPIDDWARQALAFWLAEHRRRRAGLT